MSIPNGGLITETNRQYYAGAQQKYITTAGAGQTITSTFDTPLIFGSSDVSNNSYLLNSFKIFTSPNALTWTELTSDAAVSTTTMLAPAAGVALGTSQTIVILIANTNVVPGMLIKNSTGTITYGSVTSVTSSTTFICNITVAIPALIAGVALRLNSPSPWAMLTANIITIASYLAANTYIKIQLNQDVINQNCGSYEYTRLTDVIDNFLIAYVGAGKIIPSVKRTDVIFHAKRGLQEFSYDTLKSTRSQELSVNNALSIIIPQDYVNYVQLSWIDSNGVKHIIYPTTLTINPTFVPLQDDRGLPTQDVYGNSIQAEQAITNSNWRKANDSSISGNVTNRDVNNGSNAFDWSWWKSAYGQRYGLDPVTSQKNGWFTIDERRGVFAFSSGLAGRLITLEYISDGLAYDTDSKVPKMAEDALYSYMVYNIISYMPKTPEYIVQRFKKEKSAKLRNAKIRLSNIKIGEFTQIMRGKSKWIKH
jgi:hypothetical protein